MSYYLEWISPRGDVLTFGASPPYVLRSADGLSSTRVEPQTHKAPYQHGETLLDASISARSITLQLAIIPGADDIDTLRNRLARAMLVETAPHGEPKVGVLRLYRPGHEPLEIECIPRDSPQISDAGGRAVAFADIELYCPYPFWREIKDRMVVMERAGGFTFPLQFPLEMLTHNVSVEIENPGDVKTPILARIHGPCNTPRLINETTGEEIEITGDVPQGSYIEIQTDFGRKRVTVVDESGNAISGMPRVNMAKSSFWSLLPGVNRLRFEAADNAGAKALVYYRPRYAGV